VGKNNEATEAVNGMMENHSPPNYLMITVYVP